MIELRAVDFVRAAEIGEPDLAERAVQPRKAALSGVDGRGADRRRSRGRSATVKRSADHVRGNREPLSQAERRPRRHFAEADHTAISRRAPGRYSRSRTATGHHHLGARTFRDRGRVALPESAVSSRVGRGGREMGRDPCAFVKLKAGADASARRSSRSAAINRAIQGTKSVVFGPLPTTARPDPEFVMREQRAAKYDQTCANRLKVATAVAMRRVPIADLCKRHKPRACLFYDRKVRSSSPFGVLADCPLRVMSA